MSYSVLYDIEPRFQLLIFTSSCEGLQFVLSSHTQDMQGSLVTHLLYFYSHVTTKTQGLMAPLLALRMAMF